MSDSMMTPVVASVVPLQAQRPKVYEITSKQEEAFRALGIDLYEVDTQVLVEAFLEDLYEAGYEVVPKTASTIRRGRHEYPLGNRVEGMDFRPDLGADHYY